MAIRLLAEDESGELKLEPIPQVPVYVLTSEKNLEDSEIGPLWKEVQEESADLSPNTKRKIAEGSGHFIQQDSPDLGADAVRDVLNRARPPK